MKIFTTRSNQAICVINTKKAIKIVKYIVILALMWQILIDVLYMRTWLDDYMYSIKGYMIFKGQVNWHTAVFNQYMPMPLLIFGLFQFIFGPSLLVTRIVSAICLLISLYLVYRLIYSIKGEFAATFFLAIMCFSPTMVQYLVSGSSYSVEVLFLSLCYYLFYTKQKSTVYLVLASISSTMVFFSRDTMLPAVFIFWVAVWLNTKNKRSVFFSIATSVFVFAFFLIYFYPSIWLSFNYLPVLNKVFKLLGFKVVNFNTPLIPSTPLFGKRNLKQMLIFLYPNLLFSTVFCATLIYFVKNLKNKKRPTDLVLQSVSLTIFCIGFVIHSLSNGLLICYVNYFGIMGGIFISLNSKELIGESIINRGRVKQVVVISIILLVIVLSPVLTNKYSWYLTDMNLLYNVPKLTQTEPVYVVQKHSAEIFRDNIEEGSAIFPLMYPTSTLFEANILPGEQFVFGIPFDFVSNKDNQVVSEFNKFNLEMVSKWLKKDVSVVIVSENFKNQLLRSNQDGKDLVSALDINLSQNFHLAMRQGDISIYKRNS